MPTVIYEPFIYCQCKVSNSQLNSTMKENVSCSRLNVDQEVLKVFLRETLIVNNQNERTVLP